jgi:hypothetical protein
LEALENSNLNKMFIALPKINETEVNFDDFKAVKTHSVVLCVFTVGLDNNFGIVL